ncbi:MAG TPA: aminoglycoside phosphotransferase family protein [Actinophytocola sp.]|uniref:aminoglycoside phosphotransferase family protein n=1 Tax=Actinophytocola sp. TaxID=1872138 RepID=UPI002DBFEA67|nr:aminoglycoside phosphotransferase family protein [Actinophytocola sp.]HEU5472935.1 aminoglycoside phosphotransferase family protein [Actinophytocola sp.]
MDSRGGPRGVLSPYAVELPWWQEVWDVVAGARQVHGIDVVVLRLLKADRSRPPGGAVTYLAEYDGRLPAGCSRTVADGTGWTAPDPLRMPWASPGGPAAGLAWAHRMLGGIGAADQQRTWNLSSIWRLEGAWLKEVPPFFGHEPAVLTWLNTRMPGVAPRLLGADGARMLLEDVPGTDRYDAGLDETVAMLDDLLPVQVAAAGHLTELLAMGVPDRRAEPFTHAARTVVEHWTPELRPDLRASLARLVDRMPTRFAALAACGIPNTLVHGDFHRGNVRSDGGTRAILDWGDSTIGHPAADVLTLANRAPPEYRQVLLDHWCAHWRSELPASRPEEALELMRPLDALRGAIIYHGFLTAIERSEHPYHAADPLRCLHEACDPR